MARTVSLNVGSTDAVFASCIFDVQSAESTDVELTDVEGSSGGCRAR